MGSEKTEGGLKVQEVQLSTSEVLPPFKEGVNLIVPWSVAIREKRSDLYYADGMVENKTTRIKTVKRLVRVVKEGD